MSHNYTGSGVVGLGGGSKGESQLINWSGPDLEDSLAYLMGRYRQQQYIVFIHTSMGVLFSQLHPHDPVYSNIFSNFFFICLLYLICTFSVVVYSSKCNAYHVVSTSQCSHPANNGNCLQANPYPHFKVVQGSLVCSGIELVGVFLLPKQYILICQTVKYGLLCAFGASF